MWQSKTGRTALLEFAVAFAFALSPITTAAAQVGREPAAQEPQFLMASASASSSSRGTAALVPVDVKQVPILGRRLTLDLEGVTLREALATISSKAKLELLYGDGVLPLDRRVHLRAQTITVAAALTDVLLGTGVDVVFNREFGASLVKRESGRSSGQRSSGGAIFGRITDRETRTPIVGASVSLALVDTVLRTVSGDSGKFMIADVPAGEHAVKARYIGYRAFTKNVMVDSVPVEVDFALEAQPAQLDELVTTATGRQRRRNVANDITVLNADSIVRTQPVASLTDLLESRVPGLTVQRTSGAPGDPARLRLRGPSSPLKNNDPIVVVDGIRMYAEQSAARGANLAGLGDTTRVAANAYATPSPLDYIDPNSIETIEVVKGPSAATLYGQDAANGVIVITTKKGQVGPTRWTGSVKYGQTHMAGDYPNLLLRFGHRLSDNLPGLCPITNITQVNATNVSPCSGDSVVTFQMLNDPALTVLDRGHAVLATLTASGGSSAIRYSVTGSYRTEMGLIKLPTYEADRYQTLLGTAAPDWMQRPQNLRYWNATSSLTAGLGATARVSLTASLSRTAQQRSSLEQQLGTLMSTYLDQPSGLYYQYSSGETRGLTEVAGAVLKSYYERATAVATDFRNGLNFSWEPRRWLELRSDAGLDVQQRADEIFVPRILLVAGDSTVGALKYGEGTTVVGTVNAGAIATVPLSIFRLRFATGANYTGRSIADVSAQTSNLPPGTSAQGGVIDGLRRTITDDATFGWYVEPSLTHPRFSLTLGLRLDGGSSSSGVTLPKFPKLGFTYLISDERFYPLKNIIPVLLVRVAYGKASRQPGLTDRLRLYGETQSLWGDGEFAPSVALQTIGNTEVRPERSTEFEGGFDAELLDSRLRVRATGYRKTTDDALLSVPIAPSVYGAGMRVSRNVGVTRNTGLELTVGTQLVRSALVTWVAELEISRRRDMVIALAPGVEPFYIQGSGGDAAGGIRVAPGYPLFGRWIKPILGYADANGNNALERDEYQVGDTAVYVGSTTPNYTTSLHTSVGLWGGAVAVSAGLDYNDGLSQLNEVAQKLAPFSRGWNVPGTTLAEQAAMADLAGLASARFGTTTGYNWIQTVSTLRFNDLSVRYMVPAAIARRVGAQQLSIAVQGSNLGLWTNYRGLDPNVNAFSTGNGVTDTGVLPRPRTWLVQVNAAY